MGLPEFRTTSLSMIGEMLDQFQELTWNLFHWPTARHAAITLEMNRNAENRPEPFTEFDVMPHLGVAPKPDPIDRDRAMFEQFQQFFPGLEPGD